MAITNFTVAVNKQRANDGTGPTADFIRVTAFGKTAELVDRYLKKGRKVSVEGRIQNNNYTDKDGKTVYRDDVIANRVEFLSPANEGDRVGGGGGYNQGQFSQPQAQPAFGGGQGGGFGGGAAAPQGGGFGSGFADDGFDGPFQGGGRPAPVQAPVAPAQAPVYQESAPVAPAGVPDSSPLIDTNDYPGEFIGLDDEDSDVPF
jgi:single-strand DNA-binding protein